MNPMLMAALGSLLRTALAGAAGYLVSKGIWTDAEAGTYMTAAVAGLLALGWSLWQKYAGRLRLMTALASPASSEAQNLVRVQAGQAPSVTLPPMQMPHLNLHGTPTIRRDA